MTADERLPINRYRLCPRCSEIVSTRRWWGELAVCPACGYHGRLTASQRIASLADPGSVEPLPWRAHTQDVLGFVDTVPYPRRLAAARALTGISEAVACVRAEVHGCRTVLAVMDFRFLAGSLGTAVGELVTRTAATALAERTPLLLVTASGGARMQEGVLALMQMARTSAALAELSEAGVLTISLITDPTYGGVAASFATLADVIVAEPGARLGFAGRRVIEQTVRETLPPDFQTAEFLAERGFVDLVAPRSTLRREIGHLLRVGGRVRRGDDVPFERAAVVDDPTRLASTRPWDLVARARSLDRPTTLDYLSTAFTDFQELRGDGVSGDCRAIVGGTAWLGGIPMMVVGHQKGHTAAELADRNFGMPQPAGYRKAARLMRLAGRLGLPVVTLVDTPGAHPGARSEEHGQATAIAGCIQLMSSLPVPVVSVITGEGASGGALALATANRVLIFSNGIYSVISPEGCASILWRDAAAAPRAAEALGIDAGTLLGLGVVDGVITEPEGGTGAAPGLAANRLRSAIVSEIRALAVLSPGELVADRRERFHRFGSRVDDPGQSAVSPLGETG